MWFSLLWRVIVLILVAGIEIEVLDLGRTLMNMPFDGAMVAGVLLIVISLFAGAWLILHILTPHGGAKHEV